MLLQHICQIHFLLYFIVLYIIDISTRVFLMMLLVPFHLLTYKRSNVFCHFQIVVLWNVDRPLPPKSRWPSINVALTVVQGDSKVRMKAGAACLSLCSMYNLISRWLVNCSIEQGVHRVNAHPTIKGKHWHISITDLPPFPLISVSGFQYWSEPCQP